jgi:hypothetical protein
MEAECSISAIERSTKSLEEVAAVFERRALWR